MFLLGEPQRIFLADQNFNIRWYTYTASRTLQVLIYYTSKYNKEIISHV